LALTVLGLALAIRGRHRGIALYRAYFKESSRGRRSMAASGFYLTFAVIRFLPHTIRTRYGSF
jgi:hypothetical protein